MDCFKSFVFVGVLWACYVNTAHPQSLVTLYSFCDNSDCAQVASNFVQGTNGELYATTQSGGAYGQGSIFKLTVGGKVATVYSFCEQTGCPDGSFPSMGLIQGADGNLYGMTSAGGVAYSGGAGTVFRTTSRGALTTLYTFCEEYTCGYEAFPATALIQASDGNLYGTTTSGFYYGENVIAPTVFKLIPGGTLDTVIALCNYNFNGCNGTGGPTSLIQARDGNLYGTTASGGTAEFGSVFKLTISGTLTILHNFCSKKPGKCIDGQGPATPPVQVADGVFFGTTPYGGRAANDSIGSGTVYKINATGDFITVYDFNDPVQGGSSLGQPQGLILGTDGNLYGVAATGGGYGHGAIFKLTPAGILTTLYSFCGSAGCPDGSEPQASLFQATDGNMYGSTLTGGAHGLGTVFRLNVGLPPFVQPVPSTGNAGTVIQILGTNLTGTTSVTFGGTEAIFKRVSSTQITATVPANAKSGTVRVVTPGGTLISNVKFFVQ